MTKTLEDLCSLIDQFFPFSIQEDWDNSGLQIGNLKERLKNLAVCLDVNTGVIEFAYKKGANLIISHHPLLFNSVKKIDFSSSYGKILKELIVKKISVISLHTNLDKCLRTCFSLVNDLWIKKCRPIVQKDLTNKYKLAVFVPSGYVEEVKDAVFSVINRYSLNYTDVSFSSKGVGTFTPSKEANPFKGNYGARELVNEERIEFLVDLEKLSEVINAVYKVHPYEEPAFDVYPLKNESLSSAFGFGLFGDVEIKGLSLKEVENILKEKLNIKTLRKVGSSVKEVKSIAICPGSGASLLEDVAKIAPSIYITGDLKYHDAQKAEELNLTVYDVGHFSMENLLMRDFSIYLQGIFNKNNYDSNIYFFDRSKDFFINC